MIIPAFNLARYLPAAIDSALAQDFCGGPVEVIVVDDGSTDDTPRVLDGYRDRVRVIRQPNRGLVGAVQRGLQAAGGEYIALLDADDEWPRDRLVRHVAMLDCDPALGLVHGDMEVVNEAGDIVHPSFFAAQRIVPSTGRVLGRLLAGNFVSGGASTFRASLLPAVCPIADAAAYPDWWIAAGVAAVAEIGTAPGIANRYRYHGANMSLGSGADAQPRIQRIELPWRRWMLTHLVEDDTVSVADLRGAWGAWRSGLLTAGSVSAESVRGLLEVDRAGALAALDGVASARAGGRASRALLRALACDPFDGALALDLELALARDAQFPVVPAPPPLASVPTRSAVTLAWLDELLARPGVLRAYARAAVSDSDGTLLVLAPRGADLSDLVSLVESEPLLDDDCCDITVLPEPATTPARSWLAARASSRLTETGDDAYAALPAHDAAQPGAGASLATL